MEKIDIEQKYQKFLNSLFNSTYRNSWRIYHKLPITDPEFEKSMLLAKDIYMLISEKNKIRSYTAVKNLACCSLSELKDAENRVGIFLEFIEQNNIDAPQQEKLCECFALISKNYNIIFGKNNEQISFYSFLGAMNDVLKKLEPTPSFPVAYIIEKYLTAAAQDKTKAAMWISLLRKANKQTSDCEILSDVHRNLYPYLQQNPLDATEAFINNFIDKILPQMLSEDNIWGARINNGCGMDCSGPLFYGFKCYASKITPKNINFLLQLSREMPVGDKAMVETVRTDALKLSGWISRDPLHDMSNGVKDVVARMIAYYDAPEQEKEQAAVDLRTALRATPTSLQTPWAEKVFDLSMYDLTSKSGQERNIDILKNIYNNMSFDSNISPITENEEFNILAQRVSSKETPTVSDIMPLIEGINNYLVDAINKQQTGISPEIVNMIAWVDQKLSLAINDMSFEYQVSFFETDDCKNVLKFSELIHSAQDGFNENEFNDFYENKVKNAADMEEAYMNIAHRQTLNLFALWQSYEENNRESGDSERSRYLTEQRKERSGSGNTLKALQNLTVYHDPSTNIGKKYIQERKEALPYRPLMRKLASMKRSSMEI
ncbi:MAG: hypothetical protein IKA03_05580 [Alphaproteobacteria bacterium]|nr:hypothetical protein [Alphaproteobacteria bacterium]